MSPLPRTLKAAALALAGLALLAPSAAPAQRRVITGKPATEEKKDEAAPPAATPAPAPAAEPARPAEESRKPAAPPPEAKSPNAEKAAPAQEEAPRRPVAEPRKEVPPAPPTVLVPKDEQGAPQGAARPAASAAKVDEVLYRKKIDKTSVTLRVRPARPLPGKTTTVLFDIVKQLPIPDPALGDRVPLENAVLYATIGRDGGKPVRYRLHALPDAGLYGVHFTAAEAGPYRIALEQRLVNAEIGDKALSTEFVLGIGQDTAMEAAEEETAVKTGRGRSALRASDAAPAAGAPTVMKALGEGWLELSAGLSNPSGATDLVAVARAMAEASARLSGQAPAAFSSQRRDFDTLAGALAAALKELPPAVGEGPARAREAMARLEAEHCDRCHVKYRFQLADDVSAWPKFTPRPTKDAPAQSGPRRPVK